VTLRVPVDSKRLDWPRMVADGVNGQIAKTDNHETRLAALETVGAAYGNVRAITASGSVAADDYLIVADATAGAVVVSLPAAATNDGRLVIVKKTDISVNTVTLDGNSAETIDGAATQVLALQYDSITVACDGAGWWIV